MKKATKNKAKDEIKKIQIPEINPATVNTVLIPAYKPNNGGLAIAGLILGIMSLSTGWISFLGFTLGVTALILSIIALKKKQNKGMSVTGIVTGSIGIIWNTIITIFVIFGLLGLVFAGSVVKRDPPILKETLMQTVKNSTTQNGSTSSGAASGQIIASGSTIDFNKGETAIFDKFKIKINSIQRNYFNDNKSYKPSLGKEFILIDLDITNNSNETAYFYPSNLQISDNGEESNYYWGTASLQKRLKSEAYASGAIKNGQIVYEVTKDSTKLKLYQETISYNIARIQSKTIYTLDLY